MVVCSFLFLSWQLVHGQAIHLKRVLSPGRKNRSLYHSRRIWSNVRSLDAGLRKRVAKSRVFTETEKRTRACVFPYLHFLDPMVCLSTVELPPWFSSPKQLTTATQSLTRPFLLEAERGADDDKDVGERRKTRNAFVVIPPPPCFLLSKAEKESGGWVQLPSLSSVCGQPTQDGCRGSRRIIVEGVGARTRVGGSPKRARRRPLIFFAFRPSTIRREKEKTDAAKHVAFLRRRASCDFLSSRRITQGEADDMVTLLLRQCPGPPLATLAGALQRKTLWNERGGSPGPCTPRVQGKKGRQ